MSEKLPFDGIVGGLLKYLEDRLIGLNPGDLPKLATVDQVAYVMATAPDGSASKEGINSALAWLKRQDTPGRAPWIDSGFTRPRHNPLFLGSIGPGRRLNTAGLIREETVYLIRLDRLAILKPLLQQAQYGSRCVMLMLGIDPTSDDQPASPHLFNDYAGADVLTLTDLLKALVGAGHIEKDGVKIEKPEKLPGNNRDLREHAVRGGTKQGSPSKFSYSAFKSWLIAQGYVIRYAPTAPTSVAQPPSPLLDALGSKVTRVGR